MSSSYNPTPGSVAYRVCRHFAKVEDEALSSADLAIKFDIKPANSVSAMLTSAVNGGLLSRNAGIYHAGKDMAKWAAGLDRTAAPPQPPAPPFPDVAPAPPRRKHAPPLDFTAIAIEDGVPIPPRVTSQRLAWAGLLERMAVGQCSAPLSNAHKAAAKGAVAAFVKDKGGKFTVAAVSDTHIRIWRTE